MPRKKAAPAPEPEATEETTPASRSRMWLHEGMVDWLNAQVGEDINTYSAADIISLAFAQRNAWRDSEEYQALLDEHGVARRGAAKPEKPAAKAKPAAKKGKAAAAAKPATAKRTRGKGKPAATEDEQPFE